MENLRFKFRAWEEETKTMYYDAEQTYDFLAGEPTIQESSFGSLLEDERYVVMQSTGLKDKNGKLIYEGDIVDTKYGKYEIKYCDKCKQFQLFMGNYCYACNGDIHWEEFIENVNKSKVIGNFFENPELLEDK